MLACQQKRDISLSDSRSRHWVLCGLCVCSVSLPTFFMLLCKLVEASVSQERLTQNLPMVQLQPCKLLDRIPPTLPHLPRGPRPLG
jgi:hypothetical protein